MAAAPRGRCPAGLAARLAAVAILMRAAPATVPMPESALDDECAIGGGADDASPGCALSALQHRAAARTGEAQEAGTPTRCESCELDCRNTCEYPGSDTCRRQCQYGCYCKCPYQCQQNNCRASRACRAAALASRAAPAPAAGDDAAPALLAQGAAAAAAWDSALAGQPAVRSPVGFMVVEASGGAEADGDAASAAPSGCGITQYSGPASGAESCFCHKSGNPTCANKPCTCREGCAGYIARGGMASTFVNTAQTTCRAAILTIPKGYYTDISDAKGRCGVGAKYLLANMLRQGYTHYQSMGEPGPVMQCIHKPSTVSVHWLHLHTFCKNGKVEDLPSRSSAYCAEMYSIGDADAVAAKLLQHA